MSQKTINFSLATITGVLLLSLLSSCSKMSSGGGEAGVSAFKESKLEGHYVAKFKPLNSSVSGFTQGNGKIQVMENHFSVAIDIKDSPVMTFHSQAIYDASECPTEANDVNHDGFIDSIELQTAFGGVLIPLDGDLASQEAAAEVAPHSDAQGNYLYYQETGLAQLLSDLFAIDLNVEDEYIKWNSVNEFLLDDKIIIIHGISDDVYLPGSVRGIGTRSERATLPIACAKIVRGGPEDDSDLGEAEEL